MDALGTYLVGEIIKALGEGALVKGAAYVAIFLVLWLQLRGVRNAVQNLSKSITNSFAAGEKRFEAIEKDVSDAKQKFEHRLTLLEQLSRRGAHEGISEV